jgi:uncharacterized membrane protein
MAADADRRADLDLQINLLTEHELTQMIGLINKIAQRLSVEASDAAHDAARDIAPEAVLDKIDEAKP